MIIYGTTGITTTPQTGNFHCPQCNTPQPYRLRQVRRFFTLYFIPLIPLDVMGRYIECLSCRGTFAEEVLTFDPEQARREMFDHFKRILVLAALSDGAIDPQERGVIKEEYQNFTGEALSDSAIAEEAHLAQSAGADLLTYVRKLAPELNPQGLALVVRMVFNVASAGDEPSPAKHQALQALPGALNISQDDFKMLLEHFAAEP